MSSSLIGSLFLVSAARYSLYDHRRRAKARSRTAEILVWLVVLFALLSHLIVSGDRVTPLRM